MIILNRFEKRFGSFPGFGALRVEALRKAAAYIFFKFGFPSKSFREVLKSRFLERHAGFRC